MAAAEYPTANEIRPDPLKVFLLSVRHVRSMIEPPSMVQFGSRNNFSIIPSSPFRMLTSDFDHSPPQLNLGSPWPAILPPPQCHRSIYDSPLSVWYLAFKSLSVLILSVLRCDWVADICGYFMDTCFPPLLNQHCQLGRWDLTKAWC